MDKLNVFVNRDDLYREHKKALMDIQFDIPIKNKSTYSIDVPLMRVEPFPMLFCKGIKLMTCIYAFEIEPVIEKNMVIYKHAILKMDRYNLITHPKTFEKIVSNIITLLGYEIPNTSTDEEYVNYLKSITTESEYNDQIYVCIPNNIRRGIIV